MRDIDILLKEILCLMKNSDYNDVNRRDKKRAQGGFKMIRTGDVRMNDEGMKDLYVMMLSLQSLQNRGITIKETFHRSVRTLLLWYQQSENMEYLDLALLHVQAYANMGFALDDREDTVRVILEKTGKKKEDFIPRGYLIGKKIRLNKTQVRSMIGRWKPSRENPMTINEVIEEIIDRVKNHAEGRYIYQYSRASGSTQEEPEVYELVINEEESYFYDVKNFRFYTFMEE